MSKRLEKLVTITAVLLLASAPSWAGRGDFDPHYGSGGLLGTGAHFGSVVLNLPDDRLIVAGGDLDGLHVRRFDANGQVDPTFGNGGEVVVPLAAGATGLFQPGVAVAAPDGALLFAGWLQDVGATQILEVVVHLDRDGDLLTAFGGHGDGMYRLTSTPQPTPDGWIPTTLMAVAVDARGRILLAERSWTADGRCGGATTVERLTPSGRRDAAFGTDGRATVPDVDLCGGVLLFGARDDGSIVIGARGDIVGLDTSGTVDATFGVEGRLPHVSQVLPDEMPRGRLLADGGLLILGTGSWSITANTVLTKFDRKGRLDSTFGAGTGSVQVDLGSTYFGVSGLRQSVGNFVLVPDSNDFYLQTSIQRADGSPVCADGIARLSIDGTPDVSFGKQGLTCLDYGAFPFTLFAAQRSGAPLFGLRDGNLYRLLVDARASPGILTRVGPWYPEVGEADGAVTIPVVRTAGHDGAVSAGFSTGPRHLDYDRYDDSNAVNPNAFNATPGSDFQAASGRLDWADGDEGERTITVTILDDGVDETVELFGVGISNPQGGALALGTSFDVAIVDNDPAPAPASPTGTDPNPSATNPTPSRGGGGSLTWGTLLAWLGVVLARRRRRRRAVEALATGAGGQACHGVAQAVQCTVPGS